MDWLDRVEFLLGEALVSLRRNTWMTFASVTTCAMALFVLGGLGSAYLGLTGYAKKISSRFEMKVFVKDGTSPEDVKAIGDAIGKIDGVETATHQSREEVWEAFRKDNPGIDVKGLEIDNPMPDAFVVKFSELAKAKNVAEQVGKMPGVEKALYLADEQNFLDQAMSAVRWLGALVGGMLLVTSGVLIYNTIRLTVVARRREIRTMQIVGATPFTVWTPMLIEGAVQGAVGGALATLVLGVVYGLIGALASGLMAFRLQSAYPFGPMLMLLAAIGAVYGVVCSGLALREREEARA